jgi:oxygen-dependent protoporphyrinogen oxidase
MTIQTAKPPQPASTSAESFHIAIIGGGISGLSTAWYLQKAQQTGVNLRYTILEQSERWGGKVLTDVHNVIEAGQFIIEGGPDSFLATQKPWATQLARELGLAERFLGTNDEKRTVYVLHKGRLKPMPDGIYLVTPTKIWPFAKSTLISPWGKLRMGLDFILPGRQDTNDESLADFIGRRLGQEAVDKLAEPLMAGIYNAVAEELSIMATFPRFRELEAKYGSLIRGMLKASKLQEEAARKNPNPNNLSAFISFKHGTQELIDTLVQQLTGDLRLATGVYHIERQPDQTYRLHLSDDTTLSADAIVLALPAYLSGQLLQTIAPESARALNEIRYVGTGTITLAYREAEVNNPLNGFGVVIPRSEKRQINALTWTTTKFNGRAPEGYVLLRAFFGGARTLHMMDMRDGEIIHIVRDELRSILGVEAEPVFSRIYRWPNAQPQYDVGHLARVDRIETHLPTSIYVTGHAFRGVGLPDCVHQSQQTAQQVVEQIKTHAPTL